MKAVPGKAICPILIKVWYAGKINKIAVKFGEHFYLLSYSEARQLLEAIQKGEGNVGHLHITKKDGVVKIKADGYAFLTDFEEALVYIIEAACTEMCLQYGKDAIEEGTA